MIFNRFSEPDTMRLDVRIPEPTPGNEQIGNQKSESAHDLVGALVGGPGVKPGFAASDATVLFGYTTHPSGTRAGNPTRISSLGPKRHHA